MIERTILLFDPAYETLGECSLVGHSCSSLRLNASGERRVGKALERMLASSTDESLPFMEGLREWADHTDILLLSFPSDRIYLWHRIVSLPLSPADRYALGFMLSHASRRQQEIWEEESRKSEVGSRK